MAGQRNRIIKIKEYIESFGICVNIGKTKACGNKGIFKHFGGKKFRIDVSKEVPEENIIPVLIHEFAHYIHYSFDPELKSLDFVFGSTSDVIEEELIKITVNDIPKDTAASLFNQKKLITAEIKQLVQVIKAVYPDFKLSSSYKKIERTLTKPVSYLLKYDKVKIFNTVYSVEHLSETFNYLSVEQCAYITLKSKKRMLGRINSRISKLNRYYNAPTELFARFVELYFLLPLKTKEIAPNAYFLFELALKDNKLPELAELSKILEKL